MRWARQEDGSALVTALLLMMVMLAIGMATLALTDGQQDQARGQRERESSFGLADAALNAQVFQLSRTWPTTTAKQYPAGCSPSSGALLPCPDAAGLAGSFTGADYSAAACPAGTPSTPWVTTVRDNGGSAGQYYSRSVVDAQPTYDASGPAGKPDGAMWVRAEGVARCRVRTVVVLVKLGVRSAPFPRKALSANWLQTTNQGHKVIVATDGSYAQPPIASPPATDQPGAVDLRCTGVAAGACAPDSTKGQIAPGVANVGTTGTTPARAVSSSLLSAFKARAEQLGTYYPAGSGCPSLTGQLVYVQDLTGCSYKDIYNTDAQPGFLVVERGILSLAGNATFYGVVYAANATNITTEVVDIQGTAAIQGAVIVDGPGGVRAGSSKSNLVYDPRAFDLIKTFSGASAVGNTYRELPAGQ